jgi:hypothetical protein
MVIFFSAFCKFIWSMLIRVGAGITVTNLAESKPGFQFVRRLLMSESSRVGAEPLFASLNDVPQ